MINQAGINLIKQFEGFRALAYICPAGVPTIGYGTTRIDGKPVHLGTVCNEEQATNWLREDVATFEAVVRHEVKVPMNENQIAALTAFVYNVGPSNFRSSTLLKLLNQGHYETVPAQLMRWNKGGGKELAGLTRRRQAEGTLFIQT